MQCKGARLQTKQTNSQTNFLQSCEHTGDERLDGRGITRGETVGGIAGVAIRSDSKAMKAGTLMHFFLKMAFVFLQKMMRLLCFP